jgi:hypothetical protein
MRNAFTEDIDIDLIGLRDLALDTRNAGEHRPE